jgi:hypothetical protein
MCAIGFRDGGVRLSGRTITLRPREDDDPLQATERRRGRKWLPTLLTSEHLEHNDPMRAMVEVERDFKKPR